jgi:hypothetical protein
MQLQARFTPKDSDKEVPFTVVEGENDTLLLYTILENNHEIKIPLISDQGILRLSDQINPFQEDIEVVEERLVGLSADWIENRSQGFDNSVDFTTSKQPGYGPDDIFVENKPFSLRQIVELIDSSDIELTPDFQRNFIWDKTRQSKLIESILLGLPLPSIYLSQYQDGRLTVVDGLQRLSTISAFLKNQLTLSNLEYLEECNGKRFSELETVLSPLRIRRFGQTQIMCFVIDYRSPSKLKFDLFRRLNTGGKPLNNQEIRNCLSRPDVQQVLKRMVSLESFGVATDWSVKDTRMDAREAALRFIYFYEQYSEETPVGSYSGDMEGTLDDFIDTLNHRNIAELERLIGIYDNALWNAYHLFGHYCFRKVLPDTVGGRRTPVNKLLMLTFTVLLSKYRHDEIVNAVSEDALLEPLAYFIASESYLFEAITYGTNAKYNIEFGFKAFKNFLNKNLIVSNE